MSYDATLTPRQCLQNNPLPGVLFYKHPTEGINVLLAPRATQNVQVKNIYTFYTEFSFCLLKIVLQILASFDIKITIVCKMLAMRGPMGHKQRLFNQNILDPASFSFSRKTKQTKANTFAISETLRAEPFFQEHGLGCLTCSTTQQQHRSKQWVKLRCHMLVAIPIWDPQQADSNRVFRVFSWLTGHLPFPRQLRIIIFREPKQGTVGQSKTWGSTGLRKFLLLNQVAPGTPQSLGGN